MSKRGRTMLGGARSIAGRVKDRIVRDLVLDARDGKQWAADRIPRGIALVVEKWVGFWYAFLFTVVIGWGGLFLVEVARWASDVPAVINTAPRLVEYAGSFGLITVLLAGIGMFGVIVVSVARVLLWVRDASKNYWNQHTPRHLNSDTASDTPPWPPTEEEKDRARAKFRKFVLYGSLLFLIITPTLLWLEVNYPNELHAIIANPGLSSFADVVDAAIWVINIEALFATISTSVSQIWIVYFILVFVIPGIFLAIATRNLLFLAEGFVRNEIEEVAEGSLLSWTGLKLTVLFAFFSLWSAAILYQVLLGP